MDKEKKRQDAVKEDRKRRELLQRLTTVISIPAYPNPVPNEFGLMDYNPDAAEMALRRLRHFRGDKESWKDTSLINALPMTEDEWLRLYQKAEKEGSLPRTLSK